MAIANRCYNNAVRSTKCSVSRGVTRPRRSSTEALDSREFTDTEPMPPALSVGKVQPTYKEISLLILPSAAGYGDEKTLYCVIVFLCTEPILAQWCQQPNQPHYYSMLNGIVCRAHSGVGQGSCAGTRRRHRTSESGLNAAPLLSVSLTRSLDRLLVTINIASRRFLAPLNFTFSIYYHMALVDPLKPS
ncbi:hypothetical protein ACJJTC_004407 [Scirpophaga incertulas]